MDFDEFRNFGKTAIELLIRYLQDIRERDVLSSAEPFSIIHTLPEEMPERPEHWQNILNDIETILLPALTHWQSPHFHGFYPSGSSMGSIVGELLIAGIGVLGFNWGCSPACTELEMIVLDWLVKFLKLPQHFQHSAEGPGGGVILGSASEAVLVAVISAREHMVRCTKMKHPERSECDIRGKLIAYSSDQSNSCIEKAGKLAVLPFKLLPTKKDFRLHAEQLEVAIKIDLSNGLIPTMCVATLGTTSTCAYDDIQALSLVCQRYKIWMHVDAAYGGAALALDEYHHLHSGLHIIDSLNMNLHKLLMVNYDCAAMWVKKSQKLIETFLVQRVYLQNSNNMNINELPDFRNWQISLGRRFRALKVWVTFRSVGAEGLRRHLRQHITLSKRFERHVLADKHFELVTKRTLGIVCFRVRGDNELTTRLVQRIHDKKQICLTQSIHREVLLLRFVICGMDTREEDVDFAWAVIQTELMEMLKHQREWRAASSIVKSENEIHNNCLKPVTDSITIALNGTNVFNSYEKHK